MHKIFAIGKRRLLPLILLTSLTISPGFAQLAEVIISAAWGDLEGEMGLINAPEMERCGPLAFSVDGDSVLILDTIHKQVKGAGKDKNMKILARDVAGWAICGDGNEGVFVQTNTQIVHVNSKINTKAMYHAKTKSGKSPKLIEGYGNDLVVDEKGQVKIQSVSQDVYPIEGAISKKQSAPSPLSYSIKRMLKNEVRIIGCDADGKDLVSVTVKIDQGELGAVLFKGTDAKGNLYVELEKMTNTGIGLEVHRYAPSGERLAVFPLSNNYFTTVYKKTEVAPDGSVYQMLTTKDGVQILRYRKEG